MSATSGIATARGIKGGAMDARFILTKETKDKMSKDLSNVKKNRLRLARLKELDEQGFLASARTRGDIARLAGCTSYKAGWAWVSHLVKDGKIEEILIGRNGTRNQYEYHIKDNAKAKVIDRIKMPEVAQPVEAVKTEVKMTIKRGETTIELTNFTTDMAVAIITALGGK